jgi:hypothetical protein
MNEFSRQVNNYENGQVVNFTPNLRASLAAEAAAAAAVVLAADRTIDRPPTQHETIFYAVDDELDEKVQMNAGPLLGSPGQLIRRRRPVINSAASAATAHRFEAAVAAGGCRRELSVLPSVDGVASLSPFHQSSTVAISAVCLNG